MLTILSGFVQPWIALKNDVIILNSYFKSFDREKPEIVKTLKN